MLNQAQIIGHLGADPETRYTQGGDAVCTLRIATTEKWKDKNSGEQREATEWHRVTAYGKLAEIMGQWLHKGSLVFIQGKIVTKKWTDRDGVERYTTEIRADEMKMLGGRQDGGQRGSDDGYQQAPRQQRQAPQRQGFDDLGDDIPF